MNAILLSSIGKVTTDAGLRRQRSRQWTVGLVAAPLLLLAGLMAVFWGATPALAVDVKVGSGCGGFATIQEGVDNASPGDVVTICAGTYNESVDLSLMGSSGGSLGDITLAARRASLS